MDSRVKPMAFYSKNVILLFATLLGSARSQVCSLEAATKALDTRTAQYSEVMANRTQDNKHKQLCLTQIRKDITEVNFKDALKLCTNAEVDILQTKWVNLNRNITGLCEQVCPNFLTLPTCKNMTFLGEIEFSKYERFCETFQQSIECSIGALNGCNFTTLYADILEPKVMSYWRYICKSGCNNIDETVAVITKCLDPFKTAKKSETCMVHNTFKECIGQADNVCPEVLALVKFIYRKYDVIDRICTTTTTVTTTPVTEMTSPVTETPEVLEQSTSIISTSALTISTTESTSKLTETAEVPRVSATQTTVLSSSKPTKRSPLTETPDVDETTKINTKAALIKDGINVKIEDCLSVEDLEVISSATIDVDSVLVFLKLESCLHNVTTDSAAVEVIRATFPDKVKQFHTRIRSEGWLVARQTLQELPQCKEQNEELTNDCSGHNYGLIHCNSVRNLKVTPTIVYASIVISTFFLTLIQ